MELKIKESEESIQRKWDSIICRAPLNGMRLKEAYFAVAEFAIGREFDSGRQKLHRFVVGLSLNRFIENTNRTKLKGRGDLIRGMNDHCPQLLADINVHGSAIAYVGIKGYKWKLLRTKRIMIDEQVKNIRESEHQYQSKLSMGGRCSDWQTIK